MIKKNNHSNQNGFTLIELMVVIALMSIITSITLSNYHGMNKSVELQNTVYNVALSIRESQTYGINKRLDSGEFSDGNPYSYGMHIDIAGNEDNENIASKRRIIVFEDVNDDKKFADDCAEPTPTECRSIIVLNTGNHISNIRVKKSSNPWADYSHQKINILFRRPNPDATIVNGNDDTDLYSRIGVQVASQSGPINGYKGCVEIGIAGDISLKNDCD